MYNKIYDSVSVSLSVVTGAISIENIYNVIGIVTLVLSCLNILITLGFKIYYSIRDHKYEEIPKHINDTTEQIKHVVEDHKDE